MKIEKAIIIGILLTIQIVIVVINPCDCRLFEEEGIQYWHGVFERKCFVGTILYSKGDSTNITIHDEFRGTPVTGLGGYIGKESTHPFDIFIEDEKTYPKEFECYDVDDTQVKACAGDDAIIEEENILFKITLPKHLKDIEQAQITLVHCKEYFEDGKKIVKVFRPVCYFEISEDNEYFYTKEGKLYYKKTGKLFKNCIYEETNYED